MSASQHPVANLPLAEVVDIRSERPAAVASHRLSGPEKVVPFSVAELVAVQLSEVKERWQLSLVQRDAVWSQIQARYLLDSLLYGYPIGSLLLCRVKLGGNVRVQRGGRYVREPAEVGRWQLLDGQQRMNALVALFAPRSETSPRYLLRLDGARNPDNVARRRESLQRDLDYIRAANADEPVGARWRWLGVGRLFAASKDVGIPNPESLARMTATELIWLASKIDPECDAERWLDEADKQRETAARRVRRLLEAWHAQSVPVVKLELETPTDVLQVFNRVNRTGTAVAGDDIFFAAVRTIWEDSEEHIDEVSRRTSLRGDRGAPRLLSRIDALRLLARRASYERDGNDLLPLDVERLGAGEKLTGEMQTLSGDSSFLDRLEHASAKATAGSGLGHALHVMPRRLLDPVLAWAVSRKGDCPSDDHFRPAWAFLLGAAAFRYASIFGPGFERLAFKAALEAGANNEEFPLRKILESCREKWKGLRLGRRSVVRLDSDAGDEKKRDLVNDNALLFLYVVQKVPFRLPEGRTAQVEHLFPQALAKTRMRWYGDESLANLHRHPKACGVWRAGNLLILDGELNNKASDKWPDVKLEKVYGDQHWPKELFLSQDEKDTLKSACVELRRQEEGGSQENRKKLLETCIPDGMKQFTAYVQSRERRILEKIKSEFPMAFDFAATERDRSK